MVPDKHSVGFVEMNKTHFSTHQMLVVHDPFGTNYKDRW